MTGETRPKEVPLVDMRARLDRAHPPLAPEDQARADLYALVARLLLAPPDAQLLSALGSGGPEAGAQPLYLGEARHPLDRAWEGLALAAALMPADAVKEEFDGLFVSIGTPPVNPYASLYLSGFMMEKPLAELRADLAALGLGRRPGSGELEDHLGALCETMRALIAGAPPLAPQTQQVQRRFFEKHLAPWYARCLDDIRRAAGANFYRHVADFTQTFFEVEAEAFVEMGEAEDGTCDVDACAEQ